MTPDLSYDYVGGRENRRSNIINRMGKEKKKRKKNRTKQNKKSIKPRNILGRYRVTVVDE